MDRGNKELLKALAFRSFFLKVTHVISSHAPLAKNKSPDCQIEQRESCVILHARGTGWVNSNTVYHKGPGKGLIVLSVPSGLPPLTSPLTIGQSPTLLCVGYLWAELSGQR